MQPYQLRLPSYRSSYLNRYHPYPRSAPSLHETVSKQKYLDAQLEDSLLGSEAPASNVAPGRVVDVETANATFANLERVVSPNSPAGTAHNCLRSVYDSGFSFLVVDLALLVLVRRKS